MPRRQPDFGPKGTIELRRLLKQVGREIVMNLIYPRCCVVALQGKTALAGLRVQDGESPVYEEVRTFTDLATELATLVDWLTFYRVTHVAIESANHSWKPIYQRMRRVFTVLEIKPGCVADVNDLGRVTSLLAHGLEPCRTMPPTPLGEASSHHLHKRNTVGVIVAAALLITVGVWKQPSRPALENPPLSMPSHTVRWQEPVVSHHYPAATQFAFALPKLDRNPEGVAVDVALEASSDRPSWLQFDHHQLSMHGMAPGTAEDQTYRLSVRARAQRGGDSQLLVLLTIAAQPDQSAMISPIPRLRGHWTW